MNCNRRWLISVFSFLALVESNDVLDCVGDNSGSGTPSRIGGPNACEVRPNSKPWIVNFHGCGGTLISKNIVLTAKHCCRAGFCHEGDSVTLGDHDTDDFDVGEISIEIEEVKFLPGCPDCDLALVILKEEAPSNRYIQAANLPDLDEQCPPGKEVIVCGWGSEECN